MSNEDEKNVSPQKKGKKLVISEEALRRMTLEDGELALVVGGEVPKGGNPTTTKPIGD